MGQKVNPHGLRIGINKTWDSQWYANKKDYSKWLLEDNKIRKYLLTLPNKKEFISHILINRIESEIAIDIFTSAPAIILGKEGSEIAKIVEGLKKYSSIKNIKVNVIEVENSNLDAQIVANAIAKQIENRVSFRIAQKKLIFSVMSAGAKGIKTAVSGRLGGVDMARVEGYTKGKVPRHTLRSDISYGFAEALTTYGQIGVKVWIYKGEIHGKENYLNNDKLSLNNENGQNRGDE